MSTLDLKVRSVVSLSSAEGWWIELGYRKFEPAAVFSVLEVIHEDGVVRGIPVALNIELLHHIRDELSFGSIASVPHDHLIRDLYHRTAFVSEGKVLYEDL